MKCVLVVVATMVLAAVLLPFLCSSVLDSPEDACVFCLWEQLLKAREAYHRFLMFGWACPFMGIGLVVTAQLHAAYGIRLLSGLIVAIYQSGYEAGMSAGTGG